MMDSSRQLDYFFNLITAIDTCILGNYPYSIADSCAATCEKFPSIVRASLIAQLVKNLPAMQETLVQFLGQEEPIEKGILLQYSWNSLVAQLVKDLPAKQETWV